MRKDHLANVRTDPFGKCPVVEVVVVRGNGRSQRGSYVWIGEQQGPALGVLDRRSMRKLRDALTIALGEGVQDNG